MPVPPRTLQAAETCNKALQQSHADDQVLHCLDSGWVHRGPPRYVELQLCLLRCCPGGICPENFSQRGSSNPHIPAGGHAVMAVMPMRPGLRDVMHLCE